MFAKNQVQRVNLSSIGRRNDQKFLLSSTCALNLWTLKAIYRSSTNNAWPECCVQFLYLLEFYNMPTWHQWFRLDHVSKHCFNVGWTLVWRRGCEAVAVSGWGSGVKRQQKHWAFELRPVRLGTNKFSGYTVRHSNVMCNNITGHQTF